MAIQKDICSIELSIFQEQKLLNCQSISLPYEQGQWELVRRYRDEFMNERFVLEQVNTDTL